MRNPAVKILLDEARKKEYKATQMHRKADQLQREADMLKIKAEEINET